MADSDKKKDVPFALFLMMSVVGYEDRFLSKNVQVLILVQFAC